MENNKKVIEFLLKGSLIAVIMVIAVMSCSVRKGVPTSEPVVLKTEELKNGQALFNSHCNTCHPGGASGVGPAINNKPLPKFLIRFQVRHGLGVMPDFEEEILTDKEVRNIAQYLVYLRKEG